MRIMNCVRHHGVSGSLTIVAVTSPSLLHFFHCPTPKCLNRLTYGCCHTAEGALIRITPLSPLLQTVSILADYILVMFYCVFYSIFFMMQETYMKTWLLKLSSQRLLKLSLSCSKLLQVSREIPNSAHAHYVLATVLEHSNQ